MRKILALCTLSVILASVALAQSPASGHIGASSYTNTYLKFSYAWPKSLFPIDKSQLNIPTPPPGGNDFVLFSARRGDQPNGIILMALKQTGTAQNLRFKDGAALLDQVLSHFGPDNHLKVLARTHPTNPDGLVFDEVDYQDNGEFAAGLVTRIDQYFVVFRINANSAADLAELTKSSLATQKLK
jgi:hypothetical protein